MPKGTRPFKRTVKWEQLNVRIDPVLLTALKTHLKDPFYLRLPYGGVQEFINDAIRSELTKRGITCDIPSSSSTNSGGTDLGETF